MIGLAARSLAQRRTTFLATFVSIALAAALTASFACLAGSAGQDGLSDADAETLVVMGTVVGAWGAVIALFALTSTIGIAVRQRTLEIATLRTIGATPRQVRRLVRTETALVALAGSVLGVLVGWAGGAALLALLREQGVVAASVRLTGEAVVLPTVGVAAVLVALVAAATAAHRSTRGPVRAVAADGAADRTRTPWWRVATGLLLVAHGTTMGAITVPVADASDDPFAPMQTAGSAGIVVAVGLAALAPVLLRWSAVVLRPVLVLAGTPGELAATHAARRSGLLAGVLGPVVVFVATAVGVVLMIGVDGRRLELSGAEADAARTITLLNYVVTGMIVVFAAILVLTSSVAVASRRRAELQRLRLVGASRDEVRRTVLVEAVLLTVVGAGLGLLASCATVLPYSAARGEGLLPDGQAWWPVLVVVVAGVLTVGSAAGACARTVPHRPPATAAPLRAEVRTA